MMAKAFPVLKRTLLLFLLFICSASCAVSLTCDSGDLSSTCRVSTEKDVTGQTVAGMGDLVIASGGSLYTSSGEGTIARIRMGGTVRVESGANMSGNFDIEATSLTVNSGGKIIADLKGYAGGNGNHDGTGPGKGFRGTEGSNSRYIVGGSGGGHGGQGGMGTRATGEGGSFYGEPDNPVSLGSGGGGAYEHWRIYYSTSSYSDFYASAKGGDGGGFIRIAVDDLVIEGLISAGGGNGTVVAGSTTVGDTSFGGGGSGGSILVGANTLRGSGTLSADGGSGNAAGGGGAGGRIAVHYDTIDFDGAFSFSGGGGLYYGQQGSLMLIPSDSGKCDVSLTAYEGRFTSIDDEGSYTSGKGLFDASITDELLVVNRIEGNLELSVHELRVPSGSVIDADGIGYPGGLSGVDGCGPGGGGNATNFDYSKVTVGGSGGGHGGNGGLGARSARGGLFHDSAEEPLEFGSGGGGALESDTICYSQWSCSSSTYRAKGGSGGGLISIDADEVLIDGSVTARGGDGTRHDVAYGGGGAGGSILLNAGSLKGTGSISVNGGLGRAGGGGAGGRMSINYGSIDFNGNISASGGSGNMYGQQGTVYITPDDPDKATIRVLPYAERFTTVSDEGSYLSGTGFLDVALEDELLTARAIEGNVNISVKEFVIPSGAHVSASLKGFPGGYFKENGLGPGGGAYASEESSSTIPVGGTGGSYGGQGGAGSRATAAGKLRYGSPEEPVDLGSGGGGSFEYDRICYSQWSCSENAHYGRGGSGGGVIYIDADRLVVDGSIESEGGRGRDDGISYGGGGSGGSVRIDAERLEGEGTISCDGGSGVSSGGGGSGGRLAINYGSIDFDGVLSASGGASGGWRHGQQGTVYLMAKDVGDCEIRMTSPAAVNSYMVSDGFIDAAITDNTMRVDSIKADINLSVSSLIVPSGKAISASFKGYPGGSSRQAGFGPAGGTYASDTDSSRRVVGGGGGGHGGQGGYGTLSGGGGTHYGSLEMPYSYGSGGGGAYDYWRICFSWWNCAEYYFTASGGFGGGVIAIDADSLVVDGSITSEGGNGTIGYYSTSAIAYGGGGSGGSVYINAGSLQGSGTLSVNGGSGNWDGGGGAGGRLKIDYGTINFNGRLTANGADSGGWRDGQHGSIYLKPYESCKCEISLYSGQDLVKYETGKGYVTGTITDYRLAVNKIEGNVNISVKDLDVPPGAVISADYMGHPGGISTQVGYGPGGGPYMNGASSSLNRGGGTGGSYGGKAGKGDYAGAAKEPYGNALYPSDYGSGGGGAYDYYRLCYSWWTCSNYYGSTSGGFGGGRLFINVSGNLTVDGRISAIGNNGSMAIVLSSVGYTLFGGGGSGGSVWIRAHTIKGSGRILTDAGNAYGYGGGGGGGRLAVHYCINEYTGTNTSRGGGGRPGADGSVVFAVLPGIECVSHCNNGIKDFDEQGTDCGGADCPPCLVNASLRYFVRDDYGLVNCTLYTNISGCWKIDGVDDSVVNNAFNTFNMTGIPIGSYRWNVQCRNILDLGEWASNATQEGWKFTVSHVG